MTKPIKLPPISEFETDDVRWALEEYATLAIEQATAEMRSLLERRRKKHEATFLELAIAQRELAEARAEVAAITKRADEIHKWYDVALERAEKAEAEVERAEPVAWQWLDTANFRKSIPEGSNASEWNPLYGRSPAPLPEVKETK
jgi:hypothetical protein